MTETAPNASVPKFGDLVRANLERLGWTMRDLERKTGLAYRTLRKVVANNKLLPPDECALIERAIGMKEGTAHALDRAHLRSVARRWGNDPPRRAPGAASSQRRQADTSGGCLSPARQGSAAAHRCE